jgi:hypothetical protein
MQPPNTCTRSLFSPFAFEGANAPTHHPTLKFVNNSLLLFLRCKFNNPTLGLISFSGCFQRCKVSDPTLLLCTAILDIHPPTQSAPTTPPSKCIKQKYYVSEKEDSKEGRCFSPDYKCQTLRKLS